MSNTITWQERTVNRPRVAIQPAEKKTRLRYSKGENDNHAKGGLPEAVQGSSVWPPGLAEHKEARSLPRIKNGRGERRGLVGKGSG